MRKQNKYLETKRLEINKKKSNHGDIKKENKTRRSKIGNKMSMDRKHNHENKNKRRQR